MIRGAMEGIRSRAALACLPRTAYGFVKRWSLYGMWGQSEAAQRSLYGNEPSIHIPRAGLQIGGGVLVGEVSEKRLGRRDTEAKLPCRIHEIDYDISRPLH